MDGVHPNRQVLFLDNSIPIPFLHDPNNPEDSYQLGFALSSSIKQRIADFEPSLIHITVPDCTCLHLIQYAREREIPLMGTYHSNIPEYMEHYGIGWLKHILSAFFRHQYNFLQALYVPTPFIHRHLTNTGNLDRVTNLGVWGRGIDLDRFSPKHRSNKFRQSLGFSESDVVVCWVGRLVPEKRIDIFCEVVRRLAARSIPFKALVIGAGPCEEEVKALPNTTFTGWMAGDDLAVAYASADVFLFPSAVETFGNVTLEAAASGLPLIVDSGCSGHLVRHGINGFACDDDDIDAYFDSTLCLVLDDERRKSMSREGREFSMQFEKRAVCRKMIENYTTVTNEFYCEYGGRHANRDSVYKNKEHSFTSGTYPRPLILVLVEYLFIVLFRVVWYMASAFLYVRESFLAPFAHVLPPATSQDMLQAPLLPISNNNQQPAANVVQVTPPLSSNTAGGRLGSISEVSSETDSSDCSTLHSKDDMQGLTPVQGKDDMEGIPGSLVMNDDDETETTVSLGDDSAEGSQIPSCKQRVMCRSERECQLDHALSKGFVSCVLFQIRLETKIRNGLGACWGSPSQAWRSIIRRKRKNSSMAVGDGSETRLIPDLRRDRSDSSDSTPMADEDFGLFVNSTQDRLNMRRQASSTGAVAIQLV